MKIRYTGEVEGRLDTRALEPGTVLSVNEALAKFLVSRGEFEYLKPRLRRKNRLDLESPMKEGGENK